MIFFSCFARNIMDPRNTRRARIFSYFLHVRFLVNVAQKSRKSQIFFSSLKARCFGVAKTEGKFHFMAPFLAMTEFK